VLDEDGADLGLEERDAVLAGGGGGGEREDNGREHGGVSREGGRARAVVG
jgi:hypothetical protein